HLREFSYKLPNTNVGNYKVKVSRNGTTQQAISDDFAANNSFNITFDSQQCPGSLKINWPTVNNATAYNIYLIEPDSLKNVGTTSLNTFTVEGLSPQVQYYLTVAPVFGLNEGWRAVAKSKTPNTGNCGSGFADGDLSLEKINNTNSIGRELTSTAYATNFNLSGTVGNQDDVAASNYKLSYSVNGGPWQSTISTQPIPPTDTLSNLFGTTSSLNVGVNTVKMAVENVAIPDTISENDTLSAVFLKVLNAPLDLTQDWVE